MKKGWDTIWGHVGLSPLTVLLISYLIQTLDFLLILSIFRYLIYHPDLGLVPVITPESQKQLLLLMLIGMFYLGQMIFAVVVGAFSDWFGRRIVLISALLFWSASFFFGALAISFHSIALLAVNRFIGGTIGAYRPLLLGSLSDLYPLPYSRFKAFSYFSSLDAIQAGMYYTVNMRLLQATIDPISSPYFYFCMAGVITLLNLVFIYYNLPETLSAPHPFNLYWHRSLKSISSIFPIPRMKRIYLIFSFAILSLLFMGQVHTNYVLEVSLEKTAGVILFFALFGACWAISSALLLPVLIKRFSGLKIFASGLCLLALVWILLPFSTFSMASYFWIIVFHGIITSLIWPNIFLMISWNVSPTQQGTATGIAQFLFSGILIAMIALIRFVFDVPIYYLQGGGLLSIALALLCLIGFKPPPEITSPLKE